MFSFNFSSNNRNSHTENGIPDLQKDVELLKAKIQEAYDKLHEDILVS